MTYKEQATKLPVNNDTVVGQTITQNNQHKEQKLYGKGT